MINNQNDLDYANNITDDEIKKYNNQKIIQVPICNQVKIDFNDYAMAVIQDRALPDIRDGLKPVQRRIAYSMYELGCLPNAQSKKSARIVGDVLGKYHPHGDTSVYEAMVGMTQDFNKNTPLIDGQGNFGSIDGHGAAAMRYCFTSDTNIMTDRGLLKLSDFVSKDVFDKSQFISPEELENKLGIFEKEIDINVSSLTYIEDKIKYDTSYQKASKWIYSGFHDVYELETSNGYTVKCTINEPLLTLDNNQNVVWKTLEELELGDYVLLNKLPTFFSNEEVEYKEDDKIHIFMKKYLSKINSSFNKYKILGELVRIKEWHNNNKLFNAIDFSNNNIKVIFDAFQDMDFEIKDYEKHLFLSNKYDLMGFFLGYLKSDYLKNSNNLLIAKNNELLDLFKQIFINYFGIKTKKIKKYEEFKVDYINQKIEESLETEDYIDYDDSNYDFFFEKDDFEDYFFMEINNEVTSYFYDFITDYDNSIDFVNTLNLSLNINDDYNDFYHKDTINSITPIGKKDVYDLTVTNTHAFIANGLVAHNTEAKLSKIGYHGLFSDIEKDIVDFIPNYDGSEKEPAVLPVSFPQLLVNGVNGIAVAVATYIPPHNLGESIDAVLALQNNPDLTTDDLIKIMPAPDFPTGGTVYNLSGYRSAVESGNGTVTVKSKYRVEEISNGKRKQKVLVIYEIPYKVKKAELFEKLQIALRDKLYPELNEWISLVQDETDKNGVRIAIYLKNGTNISPEIVFNHLLKNFPFKMSYSYNVVVIDENKNYKTVGFKEILNNFLNFRKDIIVRRTQFLLNKVKKELHIYSGLMKVLVDIESLVQLIKSNSNNKDANLALQNKYDLDEVQAQEVLNMRLQKLTSYELDNIRGKFNDLTKEVENLSDLLVNDERIKNIIRDDLIDFKNKYKVDRKTDYSFSDNKIEMKDFIKKEDCIVVLTKNGYVKRIPLNDINKQNKNTKGKKTLEMKDDDSVQTILNTNTHDFILFFTNSGKVFSDRVWNLSDEKGKHIRNIFEKIDSNIISMINISESDFNRNDLYALTVSKLGKIKRTPINQYLNATRLQSGINGFKLDDNDELITTLLCKDYDQLMLVTSDNIVNRFLIDDINFRPLSRTASGVDGVKLNKKINEVIIDAIVISVDADKIKFDTQLVDNLVLDENGDITIIGKKYRKDGEKEVNIFNNELVDNENFLLAISENGVGKKINLSDFKLQKRKSKGLILIKENSKSGKLIKTSIVNNENQIIITTEKKTIKIDVKDIPTLSRNATGNYLMKVEEDDKVIDIAII